jgi:nucleotide-binding universal stress UspA family protein
MYDQFKRPENKIIVATSLTAKNDKLFQVAINLAKRTGMTLRFVNVRDVPLNASYVFGIYPESVLSASTYESLYLEDSKSYEDRLHTLVHDMRKHAKVETHVINDGSVADCLITEAKSHKSPLILCGTSTNGSRFVPRGLSTALSLMANSPIPVMIVGEDCDRLLEKQSLNILVADDLSDQSRAAIHTGCELAVAWPETDFNHIHVHKADEKELVAFANSILKLTRGRTDVNLVELSGDTVIERLIMQTKDELQARVGFVSFLFTEKGGKYSQHIVFGSPREQICATAEALDVDLIIFGRHRAVFGHKSFFGKVPFYSMLSLKRPIVVSSQV